MAAMIRALTWAFVVTVLTAGVGCHDSSTGGVPPGDVQSESDDPPPDDPPPDDPPPDDPPPDDPPPDDPPDPISLLVRIDFDSEGLPAGTILDSVAGTSDLGDVGPVGVFGFRPSLAGNTALLFDSSAPPGLDFDLGCPNETFGGPGVGVAGEAGMPNENALPQGNLLCFAQDLIDMDGDGLIDIPNDAFETDMVLGIDFAGITTPFPVTTVTLLSITAVDIEAPEGLEVRFYDANDALLGAAIVGEVGDNGVLPIDLGASPAGDGIGVVGVARIEVELDGSGAIDDIEFLMEGVPEVE